MRTIWNDLERPGTIWNDLERSGTIWNDMERYGTIWNDMERYGTIWNDMERYGTIWNDMELERSGTFVKVRRTYRQESYERPVLYIRGIRVEYMFKTLRLKRSLK
jgi:hypothetical protein